MRCPECDVRNSVAASKCVECGKSLPRKRTPMPYVVGGIAVIGLAGAGLMGIGAAVTTKKDPQSDLASVAKRVASGPKTPAEAEKLKAELDKGIKEYLRRAGTMSGPEIVSAMQSALPSQAFEVHVFELQRGLKIVEIDTMLQAACYLVMKNETDVKVVNMPGLEVCDGAQVISDTAGPVLIAVGHTAGQGARRPLVKVYALMPDAIRDQSDKSVPQIKGEGNASFAKNNKDVNIEVSLYSVGATEGAFDVQSNAAATAEDEVLKTTLVWDHGKFNGELPGGKGQLAALHAVARSLKFGSIAPESKPYLSTDAQNQIAEVTMPQTSPFALSKIKATSKKRRNQSSNRFALFSQAGSYFVELAPNNGKGGGAWVASSVKRAPAEDIQNAQLPGPAKAMPSAIVPSVVRQNIGTATDTSATASATTTKTAAPIVERRGEKQIPVKVDEHYPTPKSEPAKIVEKQPTSSTNDIARSSESSKKQPTQIAEAPKAPPKPTGGTAISRDPSIKDAPAVPVTPGFVSTSNDPSVQVRRGPSGVYRTVGKLSRGEQVEIIGKRDGWYKIRANGREGFVQESLISSSKPVGEPAHEAPPPRRAAYSTSRESNNSSSPSWAERRREERRLAREARWAAARERKSREASSPRSAPHAEEPTNFVP